MKTKEEIIEMLSQIMSTDYYSIDDLDRGWIDALNWVLNNE
jgi:hypothetical protein